MENTNDDEINILALLNVILKKRKFIFVFTALVGIGALVMLFFQKASYEAQVKMFLGRGNQSISRIQSLTVNTAVGDDSDVILSRAPSAFYEEMLKSRSFISKIASRKVNAGEGRPELDLYEFFKIDTSKDTAKKENDIYHALTGAIKTEFSPKSSIMMIKVKAAEAAVSASLANIIGEELGNSSLEFFSNRGRARRKFIEEKLKETEYSLQRSEGALKQFREMNRRISDSPDLQLKEEKLKRAVRLDEDMYFALNKELEMTRMEENQDISPIFVLEPASVPLHKAGKRRLVVLVISIIAGFFFSVFMSFIIHAWANIKKQETPESKEFSNNCAEAVNDLKKLFGLHTK